MTVEAPLNLWREVILPDWIDHNGHMNDAYYTLIFDHAVDALWEFIGVGETYRSNGTGSTFAVEQHITWDREVMEGDPVRIESRILGYDEKRIHHYHEMFHADDGFCAATSSFLSLHVDLSSRRVAPMPVSVGDRLAEIWETHKDLPRPAKADSAIRTPVPPAG